MQWHKQTYLITVCAFMVRFYKFTCRKCLRKKENKSVTHSPLSIMTSFRVFRLLQWLIKCHVRTAKRFNDSNMAFVQLEISFKRLWVQMHSLVDCVFHNLTHCAFFKFYHRLLNASSTEYKLVCPVSFPAQFVRHFWFPQRLSATSWFLLRLLFIINGFLPRLSVRDRKHNRADCLVKKPFLAQGSLARKKMAWTVSAEATYDVQSRQEQKIGRVVYNLWDTMFHYKL